MKIIEVRDGFIKFEADKSIYLSAFVRIDGMQKVYIAQVNKLNSFGENSIAVAKLLFVFENNELKNYDKTEPSKDSEIKECTFDILNNSIKYNSPVIVGKTADEINNIAIDSSAFNKKMMICVDNKSSNNVIVDNLTKQFLNIRKKVVIIDTLGVIDGKKFVAGKDFKLPLDEFSLDFLYESCLNDATEESKKTIIDLFSDLKEYSKTVNFVPFDVLKTIVDNMVDKEHIFKLLVLKNKLSKFASAGYFASKQDEVNNLNEIFSTDSVVLDLSKLDTLFQNRYLAYIYSLLETKTNIQVFLETANTISKSNLQRILKIDNIPTTIVTHSRFKYLSDIKNVFDNFILEPSVTINEIFKIYGSLLSVLKNDSCLITGESTNYIPLVSKIQVIDDLIEPPPVATQLPSTEVQNSDDTETTIETEEPDNTVSEEDDDIVFEEEGEELNISPSKDDIISNIDKKSDDAIARVTDGLEQPENINLFSDTDDSEDTEEVETITEESEEAETTEENGDEQIAEEIEEISDSDDEIVQENDIEDYDSDTDISDVEQDETLTEDFNSAEEDSELTQELEFVDENSYITETSGEEITEEDLSEEDLSDEEDIIELTEDSNEDVFTDDIENESDNITEEEILTEELSEPKIDYENDEEIQDSDEINEYEPIDYAPSDNEEIEVSEEIIQEEQYEELNDNTDEMSLSNQDDNSLILEELETENEDEKTTYIDIDESDLDISTSESDADNKELEEEQSKLAELESKFEEPTILPINNSSEDTEDFSEIVELDPSEADENDIVIDMTDNISETIDEDTEKKIMENVDKVYTTLKDDDNKEEIDEYSESDLDLIDKLNSDDTEILDEEISSDIEELPEGDGILDEKASKESIEAFNSEILEKKNASTPIVPVYDASIPQEDIVMSDPIEQGDNVYHAKYGNGVVEKMIKYGNKSLYSINFENIGRRLLDPTLTEIKKA